MKAIIKHVAKTTLTIPHLYPIGSAVDFINDMLVNETAGKIIIYSVIHENSNELIGFIREK